MGGTTKFKIICRHCESDNVGVYLWHDGEHTGTRLKCENCGVEEEL